MKHAYLIMAHNEFDILEKLLRLLDDPRNDFYIHIDRKVTDFPFDYFRTLPKHSKVVFTRRLDNRWGDFSLTQCELLLLETALQGNYRYYHVLSGVDLPLKSNDAIHTFFAENDGKEFVHYRVVGERDLLWERVDRFYCMRLTSARNPLLRKLGLGLDFVLRKLRRLYRRPWETAKTLAYGSQWFSITHALAAYLLEQKIWIRKYFRWTACSDEMFAQTAVENSPFREKLYRLEKDGDMQANMRYIDWSRGNGKNPWTFGMDDLQMLKDSPYLFARKFSTKHDARVVEEIYQYILEKNRG